MQDVGVERRKPLDQLGAEIELQRRAYPTEPRDLDAAVVFERRRPAFVVDAEHLHPRAEFNLGREGGRVCASIPPGAGG